FDLRGLPPTPAEMARFAGDDSPSAYADLVDRYLDSPHFGERWARHWMDLFRYSDSHGSEGDPDIPFAWRYRDYLIRAFNRDVPYDQLIREHIAGDLLGSPRLDADRNTNESIIGTANFRLVEHGFQPVDPWEDRVKWTDNQVDVTSKAFLGLTVSCARCHDHKFDAISQQDYYALFGILSSCRPARAVIDLPARQNRGKDKLMELKPRIRQAIADDWRGAVNDFRQTLLQETGPVQAASKPEQPLHPLWQLKESAQAGKSFDHAWSQLSRQWKEASSRPDPKHLIQAWKLADPGQWEQWSTHGIGLPRQPHRPGEFAIAPEGDMVLHGIYPAGVYSHTLSAKHPARLTSIDIDVGQEAELWVRAIGDGGASLRYVVQDYPRNGTVYPVTKLKPDWNWQRYDLTYWAGDKIHLELAAGPDAPLLVSNPPRSWFGVTEARLVPKGSPPPKTVSPLVAMLLEVQDSIAPESDDDLLSYDHVVQQLTSQLDQAITAWNRQTATDLQAEWLNLCLREGLLPNRLESLPTAAPLVKEYRQIEQAVPNLVRVPGLDETVGRTQPLYVRGNHKQPSADVPRRFLEAIDPTPYATPQSGRLQLANDLLREDNPLTRRVIVNRLWHHLFGRGIVATPDNFGRLGQTPSHPELLDWLATRFAQDGWSLKKTIRLIVTSQTWQRSSRASENAGKLDPNNVLLSHANLRRMDAEVIRDSLLSVSGRLDRNPYGSPVDGNSPRRSVYVRVIRNSLDPFLRVFDFPEPFSATGRRDVTNVPAQSLTLMNDPRIAAYASDFANRILTDPQLTTDEERLRQMFAVGFARFPLPSESRRALDFLAQTRQTHAKLKKQAQQLRGEVSERRALIAGLLDPARDRLVKQAEDKTKTKPRSLPQPVARWEFDGDLQDAVGSLHGVARAGAATDSGALVADGKSHVVTSPLTFSLDEKTLEAWVQLDHLGQRGGGVMSVQTPDGIVFDSIVFGEKDPQQWLSGSNHFARTQSFGAEPEGGADKRFVHVAIAYHADGRIVGYRDGKPYGQPYQSDGPFEFKSGHAVVSFGVRHLPAGGNRLLTGKIQLAQLYDRALSAEEIAASAGGPKVDVSAAEVLASLSPADRARVAQAREEIDELEGQIKSLGPIAKGSGPQQAWTDLAKAFFTLKEFIYVP
ncbi:MAG: DUF1553 domain-containing protein, partial [Pirellulales bacterium]|nr:DUF1553 domain-containing protein [Pirellulales bacterium]